MKHTSQVILHYHASLKVNMSKSLFYFVPVPSQDLDLHLNMSWSFLVQCFELKGSCLFYWFWRHCWPSLFKLSFVLLILVALLSWKVVVCFVDIGGIVDHHCLNCLLFCWYWWKCWLSLFKLSFVLLILVALLTITV